MIWEARTPGQSNKEILLSDWPSARLHELQDVTLDLGDIWTKSVNTFIRPTFSATNSLSKPGHLPMADLHLWCGGGSLARVLQCPFELACIKFNSEFNDTQFNVSPIWLKEHLNIVSQGAAMKELLVCPPSLQTCALQ